MRAQRNAWSSRVMTLAVPESLGPAVDPALAAELAVAHDAPPDAPIAPTEGHPMFKTIVVGARPRP
jgi:hypothetical protein